MVCVNVQEIIRKSGVLMPSSSWRVKTVGTTWSSSKMRSSGPVLAASKRCTMIVRIMAAANGVLLQILILEISVPSSRDRKTDFMDTGLRNRISSCRSKCLYQGGCTANLNVK